jgi:hypothetical protein
LTAFHAETDGLTERANQEVEHFLCSFTNYNQSDWAFLCLIAILALNGHNSASTSVSPFFLDHRYYLEPLDIKGIVQGFNNLKTPAEQAQIIVVKIRDISDFIYATMAAL